VAQDRTGRTPFVLLVKDHTAIPHAQIAQSTAEINWREIKLRVFSSDRAAASGLFALPGEGLQALKLDSSA
jgi:alpha-D-xyloside xylohydrolase